FKVGVHERTARSAGDKLKRTIHGAHLASGVGGLAAIVRSSHVADLPRSVHLVSQAPVFHPMRLYCAVANAPIAPARTLVYVAVFHQSGGIRGAAGAEVDD